MLMPSLRCGRETAVIVRVSSFSAAGAIDGVDNRRCAQRGDDVGEMPDVLHLDVDQNLEEIRRAVGDLEIGDVAAVLADNGREAAETAGLVAERDVDPADMRDGVRLAAVPG